MSRSGRKRSKVRFSDLSPWQQATLVALGVVEVGLLLVAEVDIQRRPEAQVVGRKAWWRAIRLINVIGPLSYFRWGRRTPTRQPEHTRRSLRLVETDCQGGPVGDTRLAA